MWKSCTKWPHWWELSNFPSMFLMVGYSISSWLTQDLNGSLTNGLFHQKKLVSGDSIATCEALPKNFIDESSRLRWLWLRLVFLSIDKFLSRIISMGLLNAFIWIYCILIVLFDLLDGRDLSNLVLEDVYYLLSSVLVVDTFIYISTDFLVADYFKKWLFIEWSLLECWLDLVKLWLVF